MFAIGTYIAFLLISVVPLFADAVNLANFQDRRWFDALWFGIHSLPDLGWEINDSIGYGMLHLIGIHGSHDICWCGMHRRMEPVQSGSSVHQPLYQSSLRHPVRMDIQCLGDLNP
jgi:hypothetical protein